MRTSEEVTDEIIRRIDMVSREKAAKRRRIYSICATAACLLLIVGLAFVLPAPPETAPDIPNAASATILGDAGWGGYVIIGVVGIVLGAALTLFCLKLHEKKREVKGFADLGKD